jgi:hypothetical protein
MLALKSCDGNIHRSHVTWQVSNTTVMEVSVA